MFVMYLKTNKMTEKETQVNEVEIYGYINNKGEKVITPNLEFAHIMATKYGTNNVFVIKD
jgi:hypothetical protein